MTEKIDIEMSASTFLSEYGLGGEYESICTRIIKSIEHYSHISTLRDLCRTNTNDVKRLRFCGRASMEFIKKSLEKYDLRLGMSENELDRYAGVVQPKEDGIDWEQRKWDLAVGIMMCNREKGMDAFSNFDAIREAQEFIEDYKAMTK